MSSDAENATQCIWKGDLLNREADAKFIQTFLVNRLDERFAGGKPRSYVLNVDASWGSGKTFFLNRLRQQLLADGHVVAFVDAWRDDHTDEPLTAVMAAVDEAVKPFLEEAKPGLAQTLDNVRRNFGLILLAGAKGGVKTFARRYLGQTAEAIADQLRADGRAHGDALAEGVLGAGKGVSDAAVAKIETLFDSAGTAALSSFQASAVSIDRFKKSLGEVVKSLAGNDRKTPLFILVDELDRCRPLYAIELLERVKHIFDIEDVVFVVATDTGQLRHSIRAVYGAEFDSHRYLHRFFDRVYKFPDPDKRRFIEFLLSSSPIAEHICRVPGRVGVKETIIYIYSCFDGSLTLRDIEQVHDVLRTITTTWTHPTSLELMYMLPLLIGWKNNVDPSKIEAGAQNLFALISKPATPSPFRFGVDHRSREMVIGLKDYFVALHQAKNQPLEEAGANMNDHRSHADRFAFQGMNDEFGRIHGNTFTPGAPLYSILRDYPRWIEMAGRMDSSVPRDGGTD